MADFQIPKDGLLNFESLSIRQFLKDKLTKNGTVTDAQFEGSNISNIIDIVSYSFHTLMYYLNQTSTESMFSEAQIYENMNRIVKILDYKPIGNQTSTLNFDASAQNLSGGQYTIPRYSFINLGDISYSFNTDANFSVSSTNLQDLSDLYNTNILYQGSFKEYRTYTATGQENEIVYLVPGSNIIIDHFNIHAYIQEFGSTNWEQWYQTPSLYLEDAFSKKFELRYNENQQYELRFGNNINGKRLNQGDKVVIYYLQSNGQAGEIGVNKLFGGKLTRYSTVLYDQILKNINIDGKNYITQPNMNNIVFNNSNNSTYFQSFESVDDIRNNAPSIFRTQLRLITEDDFTNYIKTNFANILHDVKTVNNWKYVSEQLKYYYDLGLTNPSDVSNVLYNQVNFADSCNFNNVYMTIVPKTIKSPTNPTLNLTPAHKKTIISSIQDIKPLTVEPIILDPVYVAIDICTPTSNTPNISDITNSQLVIIQDPNSRRDAQSIKTDIYNTFLSYFGRDNIKLGQIINLNDLTVGLLAVEGVKTFYTTRTDDNTVYNGLSMLLWNPIYVADKTLVTKNISLPYFKFVYLNDATGFLNKIVVKSDVKIFENVEY